MVTSLELDRGIRECTAGNIYSQTHRDMIERLACVGVLWRRRVGMADKIMVGPAVLYGVGLTRRLTRRLTLVFQS